MSAGTKEQDAALLADVVSDHFNDVFDLRVKSRDVPPSASVGRLPPSRAAKDHPPQTAASRHRDPEEITTTPSPGPPLSGYRQAVGVSGL